MSYRLAFLDIALKEWRKLGNVVRDPFKTKRAERLETPRVPMAILSGSTDRDKIKLRSQGYRLVNEIRDQEMVVLVIAVRKRERGDVYLAAEKR